MDLQPPNDLNPETKLYQLVQNWFKLHPGTLIPLDAWNRKLQAYGLDRNREFKIQTPHHVLTVENPGMIPLLAAISLGDDLDYLAKLVTHHSCSFYDSDSFGVSQFNEGPKLTEAGPGIAIMSRPRIERLFIGAILKNPEQLDVMRSYIDVPGNTIAIPVVLSDQENLWPDTLISEYVSRARAGEESTGVVPRQMSLSELMDSDLDLSNTPEAEILTLLRRGGILNDDARVEHLCSDFFFERLFGSQKLEWQQSKDAVIRAINGAKGDDRIAIASKLKAMVMNVASYDLERLGAALSIYTKIDKNAYPEVFASTILKLNNVGDAASPEVAASTHVDISAENLLSDLSTEIMAVKPDDFRAYHFNSLGYFAERWEDAHIANAVDMNEFVKHVMAGFKSFKAHPVQDGLEALHSQVEKDCTQFLKVALKLATPNYNKLNELDSESKLFMVRSGYKIKYFKGMTYQDKGRVLSDDLGL